MTWLVVSQTCNVSTQPLRTSPHTHTSSNACMQRVCVYARLYNTYAPAASEGSQPNSPALVSAVGNFGSPNWPSVTILVTAVTWSWVTVLVTVITHESLSVTDGGQRWIWNIARQFYMTFTHSRTSMTRWNASCVWYILCNYWHTQSLHPLPVPNKCPHYIVKACMV